MINDETLDRIEEYVRGADLFRESMRSQEENALAETRTAVYGAIRREFGMRVLENILMSKYQPRLDNLVETMQNILKDKRN